MAAWGREDELAGKVAIVTGASRGLGEGFAQGLADAGASVAVVSRSWEGAEAVAEAIRASGGSAAAFAADVRSKEQVERMVSEVGRQLGPVDILVNNAGVCYHRPAIEVPAEEWLDVIECNINGVWYCSQAIGRELIARGAGGSIVNIGSISGIIVNRPQMQPAYNASKAAVHQLTKSLAAEWAPHGIRVNALAPGYVKTGMAPVDRPDLKPFWVDGAPMGRYATVDEIVPSLLYLVSEASSFMTGSVVVIDGGYTLW